MKLSIAVDGFLLHKSVDCSHNTIRDYRNNLNQFLKYVGDKTVDAVTADDIRRYLFYLRAERKLRPKTVRNAWIALSSLWTWMEQEFGLPQIVRKVAAPPATKVEIQPFSKLEIKGLLSACDRNAVWKSTTKGPTDSSRPSRLRDKAIILFLLDTGLRAQELCNLTIGDVDVNSGAVHVRQGKGDKDRTVYIGAMTREAIWRYLQKDRKFKEPRDPLFSTSKHTHLDRRALGRMLETAGERAGLDGKCNPHRFRHTFAINYLRNGGDVFTLQQLLGHSTMEMVKHYLSIAQTDLANAHRKASPVDNWRLS